MNKSARSHPTVGAQAGSIASAGETPVEENWGSKFKRIILIAGAQISFFIGVGIASGQEAMQYFTSHGYWGLAAVVLVSIVFGGILASLTEWGRRHSSKEVNDPFVTICGKWLGTFFKITVPVFILSIAVTMVAGSGALFESMYSAPTWVGVVVLATVLALTLLMGFRGLVEIIGRVGPILIIFLGTISIWILIENFDQLSNANLWLDEFQPPKAMDNLLLSTLFYCTAVLFLAVPFIVNLGKTAKGPHSTAPSGQLAGLCFGGVLLISSAALLATLPLIHDVSTPLVLLGTEVASWLGTGFTIVTFLAMYSTAAPMLWIVADAIPTKSVTMNRIVSLALCGFAFIGALWIPFAQLIGLLYPFIGAFGLLFFIVYGIHNYRTPPKILNSQN